MKKYISLFTAFILLLITTSSVSAAGLSARLESPESPTKDKDHKLSFVALDIEGRDVSVDCFYKGPSDGSYIKFDSTKYLGAGGNNGYCQVTYNQVSPIGKYEFYVKAYAGGDQVTSNTVFFDYDNSGPDTPTNYSKEKISDCKYKISFKTADDGKTTKVEIYRSEDSQFKLEGSTRIGEVALGPNQWGEYTDNQPDCGKTYYYAIRAFDSTDSVSDAVGDNVITTYTTTTTSEETIGAIPVSQSSVGQGQILGESTDEDSKSASDSSEVMDQDSDSKDGEVLGILSKNKNTRLILLGILVLAVIYTYIRRKDN